MDKLPHSVGGPVQENFDKLLKTVKDNVSRLGVVEVAVAALQALGLTKRTRGVANVSTVAAVTGSATVTHGLGTTPNNVQATSQNTSGAGLAIVGVASIGATTFDIFIRYGDGVARTLTVVVGWEAIA